MKAQITHLLPIAFSCITVSAHAAVIASTNFNGRVLSPSNTATNLNWTSNGVNDPGIMAASNATPAAQALFNTTTLTQNNFTPALNTGNGNTFWTTTVNLTVATGFNVTISDVVFDYVAVNGGEALNVNRRSDFTVTLLNPSAVSLGEIDIIDAISGNAATPQTPTLTFTFASPIALSEPGTYTLRIKGGDYLGTGETGNHTGIDNLSINGSFAPVPEASALALLGLGTIGLCFRRRRA